MADVKTAQIRELVKERTHMQGFTYENQGQNTYLVYQFDDRPIDTMALGMLTNNKIKGFAPAIYTEIDNQKFIKYNVSSHVTLSKLFMGDVRKMRLLKTFVNIVDAMQMLDAYMLDRRTIMLDRDYIYVDASTSDVSMICVPVVDEFAPIDEREFFKNIIFSVSFAANENGDYVARILAYLNSVELFQLQDFKKMLEGLMSEQPAAGMQNVQPAMGAPYMQNNPYQQTPAGAPAQPQMNMKPAVMQQPVPPVQPQNRPTDIGQEPAIQNVYVSSGASAKDIKLAKREEMLKQQEEERAREMARNPIAPENVDMGFAVPGMSTNQYASKPKAVSAAPAQKASKGKKNSGSSEDDISLFYLMQHYSKENKEKYKAAKERKKSGSTATEAPVAKKQASVIKPVAASAVQQPPVGNPYQAAPVQPQTPAMANPYQTAPAQPQAPAMSNPYQTAPAQPQAPAMSNPYQTAPAQPQASVMNNPYPAPQMPAMGGMQDDYDQTTLIKNTGNTDDAGTTVLNAATKVERHPYLYQVKNGRKIYLDKKTNRIGKNREVVDICIDGNPAISRCHAIFYRVDDACYIEDLNSTNGTFVDDQQITSNCKTMVRVGSRVKLGDEEFELRYD
ncbi:MAG: FHA domain-containing protein [Coprococcus eutactus]|nr:FHA domain-containing protein [Coprococcus eutactus]